MTCGCGNSFSTRATVPELKIEICNVCHPFYTGKQKFVDAAGRVDRFKRKYARRGDEAVARSTGRGVSCPVPLRHSRAWRLDGRVSAGARPRCAGEPRSAR